MATFCVNIRAVVLSMWLMLAHIWFVQNCLFVFSLLFLKGPTAANQAINMKYLHPLLENNSGKKKTNSTICSILESSFPYDILLTFFLDKRQLLKMTFWDLAVALLIRAIKTEGKVSFVAAIYVLAGCCMG